MIPRGWDSGTGLAKPPRHVLGRIFTFYFYLLYYFHPFTIVTVLLRVVRRGNRLAPARTQNGLIWIRRLATRTSRVVSLCVVSLLSSDSTAFMCARASWSVV
jgi:hypothetical protein